MADNIEKNSQLVKAKISSLQRISSNIVSRGLSDLALLDVEKAKITDFNKAIQIDPNDASVYLDRGLAYHDEGQYDRAIDDYNKAIALDPNNASAYEYRWAAYCCRCQYDRAIEDYNKAIALSPSLARAYSYRGIAYYKKGIIGRAISDFQKACDLGDELGCENLHKALRQR